MPIDNVSVVFCEDIRDEIGGRHSLMGILGNKTNLSQLPANLAKLCISFAADVSSLKQVKIVCEVTSDKAASLPSVYEDFVQNPQPGEDTWNFRVNLVMHSFAVGEPLTLTARFVVDDREVQSQLKFGVGSPLMP